MKNKKAGLKAKMNKADKISELMLLDLEDDFDMDMGLTELISWDDYLEWSFFPGGFKRSDIKAGGKVYYALLDFFFPRSSPKFTAADYNNLTFAKMIHNGKHAKAIKATQAKYDPILQKEWNKIFKGIETYTVDNLNKIGDFIVLNKKAAQSYYDSVYARS